MVTSWVYFLETVKYKGLKYRSKEAVTLLSEEGEKMKKLLALLMAEIGRAHV